MAPAANMPARKQLSPKLRAAIWIWAYIDFLFIFSILPTPIVTALKPVVVYGPAYATINEDLFIIQGGGVYQNATFTANISQFIALDLTRPSWDVSDPPWILVNITSVEPLPARLATYYHSMTVSLDRQTVTIWDSASPGSVTNYTRYTGAWSTFDVPAELGRSEKQLKAAVDPNTGKIYIPLGYEGVNMMVYDPAHPNPGAATLDTQPRAVRTASTAQPDATAPTGAGTTMGVTMPNTVKKGATGYAFVWSSYRQSFLYFGGRIGLGDLADPYFFEYQPNTNAWSTLSTNGTDPPRLINSCMIPAYNGTKLILFGGHEMDGISKNTTYILDVTSMEWTKGPAVDASQSRSAMACSVSGDNVVIWGGIRKTGLDPANYTTLDTTPLIFNLLFKQWVQKFERGTHYTPLPVAPASPISPPKPEGTSAPDKEKSNVGDIVGGTLGGVLLLALVSANYIAHKKPDLLRQLICWGKEPDEHNPTKLSLLTPGEQPTRDDSPVNLTHTVTIESNIDNFQHNLPASPQNQPHDSGASTSPPVPAATSRRDANANAVSFRAHPLQHQELLGPMDISSDPPGGSMPTVAPSAPAFTTTLPPDDPSSSENGSEGKPLSSRRSTLSSTTTLRSSDPNLYSASPLRSRVMPPKVPAQSLGSILSTHPTLPPTNPTWHTHRNNNTHTLTADYDFTSDGSTPSVPLPLAIGVAPHPLYAPFDSLSDKAEVMTPTSGSQPPKQPAHSMPSSSSSSSDPPVLVKPENETVTYMKDIIVASRQQLVGGILDKSAEESNNHDTNQRPDTKNDSSTTATELTGRQVLPATTSTIETGSVEPQYPPREDDTGTRRQPQGGHEPARTSSRGPQDVGGVGTRKTTSGDEAPKLSVQKLNDDDEWDQLKKFQKW